MIKATMPSIFCVERSLSGLIFPAGEPLTEAFIKGLHAQLKTGTSDSRKEWFAVGDYKRLPNKVGGMETTPPEDVHREMKRLLAEYNARRHKTLDDILDLHQRFECIHPFQDSNGRIVAREVAEQRKALAGAHLAAAAFAARAFVLQPEAHWCAPCLVEQCEELQQVLPHGFSLFGATFSLFPPAGCFFFFACFFFFRNNSVLYGDSGGRRCGLQRFAGHSMDLRGRNRRVVLCRMTLKGI